MGKIKNYFKKKSIITALVFIFVGAACLGIMFLIPHGVTYHTINSRFKVTVGNQEYTYYMEFINNKKIKTYIKNQEGIIDNLRIDDYEIKDDKLYQNQSLVGDINVYKVKIKVITINGETQYLEYVCIGSQIAKYVSFLFIGIGVYIIIVRPIVKFAKAKPSSPSKTNSN